MWEYQLADLDPAATAEDAERWAHTLAAEGWHMWPPRTGVLVTINGRTVRRYSLRRRRPDPHRQPPVPAPGQ